MLIGRIELIPELFFPAFMKDKNGFPILRAIPSPDEIRAFGEELADQMEVIERSGEFIKSALIEDDTFCLEYTKENVLSVDSFRVDLSELQASGLDLSKVSAIVFDSDKLGDENPLWSN